MSHEVAQLNDQGLWLPGDHIHIEKKTGSDIDTSNALRVEENGQEVFPCPPQRTRRSGGASYLP